MRASIFVFMFSAVFFVIVGIIYGFATDFGELAGFPALLLLGAMSAMIGIYLWLTDRRVGRQPQDNDDAEISDADADYGMFSPWSWWPVILAAGALLNVSAREAPSVVIFVATALVGVGYAGAQVFPLAMLPDAAAVDAYRRQKTDECQGYLEKVARWEPYVLETRFGMRVQTGLESLRWLKKKKNWA